jgi:hypothetical protein
MLALGAVSFETGKILYRKFTDTGPFPPSFSTVENVHTPVESI